MARNRSNVRGMPAPKSREVVLARLAEIREDIATTQAALDALYAERLGLYQEARVMDPPLLQRELAEAAGVTEVAVTQALRKAAAAAS